MMKNRLLFRTILIFSITIFLISCAEQSKKSNEITSNNFSQALSEQLSDMKEENDIAVKEREEAYRKIAEEEKQRRIAYEEEQNRIKLERERKENEAPYGYNQWGEPYASRDHKNLDKALDKFDEARQNYIKALDIRDPMDIMFYHQKMKLEIDNCLYYAKRIGDKDIINKIERLNRWVDNLEY